MKPKEIVAIIVAILGLLGAVVEYRGKVAETEARMRAEQVAAEERERRQAAERRVQEMLDVRQFIDGYRDHLRRVRSALSRLDEFRTSPEAATRIAEAEQDVKTEVAALVTFVENWRQANDAMARLLDGNVRAADAAALQSRYDEIERAIRLLESTLADMQPVLERAVRSTKDGSAR